MFDDKVLHKGGIWKENEGKQYMHEMREREAGLFEENVSLL